MTNHRALILGAGAAGTAAARTLAEHDTIDVHLVGRSSEPPYTRMLIKTVAAGSTPPEVTRLPLPNVAFIGDTAASVDTAARRVRLESGRELEYDSLIVATGSAPRQLPATVTAHLDDGTSVTGELLIVALGTVPLPPAPWDGGIIVDDRQRTAVDGVWAAGGVSVHDDARGPWRIDHWEDSAAQGTHAALDLLRTRDLGDDPGPYLPRSPFLAMIHGHILSGVGLTTTGSTRIAAGEELVVVHELRDGTPIGVTGLDALLTVHQWRDQLHAVLLNSRP